MGLGDWILGLGIRAEQTVQGFGTRAGVVPLQWPAGPRASLIYRLPRDPHQRASIFATEQTIVVNEGELAVVLEDGKAQDALEPGRYVFQKARVTGSLDIVWVLTGQQTLKWGLGNVTSIDGIQLSANGVIYLRVADARLFNAEVVQGAVAMAEIDLQRFLMPRVQGVLRTVLAKWAALDLQAQRDLFSTAVKQSLGETFGAMGVAIVDFEVVDVNFPPEFKAIIAQAAMAGHAGRAALIEAQTKAQMVQLEAAAAANAYLLNGSAQSQVMAQLQAQGIDPLKLKALEALNTFAANPPQGGMMMGGDPSRAALFGQIAAVAVSPGVPVAAAPPPALAPGLVSPPLQARDATVQPGDNGGASGPATAQDLERQLDALVERLAEGKISEDTYNKLAARLEGKLAQLRGA